MQVTITPQAVITAASLLAALGSLGGMAAWWVRFIDRDKRQDAELKAIRREQTLLCYGMTACLKGMKEQGCNGPVTTALDKLEKHLTRRCLPNRRLSARPARPVRRQKRLTRRCQQQLSQRRR